MAEYTFNTPAGQTVARELLIAYINISKTETPEWKAIGKRVEDSSAEYDWQEETKKDIFGDTYATMKKPIITQTFDPCELDSGDPAQKWLWDNAVVKQDAMALSSVDMLIAHAYANFGERYESCQVRPSAIGGEGGGNIGMPIDVTYGGKRTIGTVSVSGGNVTFSPET